MAISTQKLALIGAVLVISVMLSFALLYSSIIPQYSVNELFSNEDPSKLIEKKIQLVGDVENMSSSESVFIIKDWEGKNYSVTVYHDTVALPAGFQLGKRVMVEGFLKHSDLRGYYLVATLISTKCPSKYL